jgi:hypothetical protein
MTLLMMDSFDEVRTIMPGNNFLGNAGEVSALCLRLFLSFSF